MLRIETVKQAALRTKRESTETKRGMTGEIGLKSQDGTRRLGDKSSAISCGAQLNSPITINGENQSACRLTQHN